MQVAKAVGRTRAPWRRDCQAGVLVLALALTTGAWAGQGTASFAVTVDLHTTPDSGTCQTNSPESPTQPSVVSIDCRTKPLEPSTNPHTPAPSSQGQAYRFWIQGNGGERYGGVDLNAGAGTITSWRVVHLTDREYLEMTVGW